MYIASFQVTIMTNKGLIKRKTVLNIAGLAIVIFWIIMLTLLARKQYVPDSPFKSQAGQAGVRAEQQDWKEIYLKGKKVGYSVDRIKPFENGYYVQDEIFLKLDLMGFEKGLYTLTESSLDDNYKLRNFYFKMTSGVINYIISGKMKGNKLIIKTGSGRRRRTKIINMPDPPMISSGMDYMFRNKDISVGDRRRVFFFDPSTMTRKDVVFTVAARETIKINGIAYDTYRIETELWGNKLRFWIDMNGNILKEEGFMGLTMVKSSAANAPLNVGTGDQEDFYDIVAVNINKRLPNPDRLMSLTLKISGIDNNDYNMNYLNDSRQHIKGDILSIKKETEPLPVGYTLPFADKGKKFSEYLKPDFNIESDNKEIIEKARQIAGGNKNPVIVSRKMMEWVYKNLEMRPVVNIPSALEVLHTRAGDCNEHATLLTALLRAVGIPARISVGLVYTRGKFYYHAWTEAYTGKWITIDPTLDQMPADVTHISLVKGNIDKQVEILGLIGKLKLEVVDFEYH